MKKQRTIAVVGLRRPCVTRILLFIFFLLISVFQNPLAAQQPSEQDMRDAVLERKSFSPEVLDKMDLNRDGKVDVADIVSSQKHVLVNFETAISQIDETAGVFYAKVNFSRTIVGTLKYITGGTATLGEDYTDISGGSIAVDGSSATIQLGISTDTIYEGDESIELNLLPSTDYYVGPQNKHTVTLKDNPYASSADYLFTLNAETLGVAGDTTQQRGFPPTLSSRSISINITFSENSVLDAMINIPQSVGLLGVLGGGETIPNSEVSYSSNTLKMVFTYNTESESFVSDPPITTFDLNDPSFSIQTKKPLTNTLTVTLNDFDVTAEKFTRQTLEGTFSLNIEGVFPEGTSPFFTGTTLATMQ